MQLEPNTRVGPYEILSVLGAGGMGEVYRARDERLGRDVAIKILPPSCAGSEDRLARFEQEAKAAGILSHPNIVAVFDIGTHDGSPYVVSELLEGETLREKLRSGPLSPRKAIDLGLQMAKGLAAAHEKGIIHRDIKPENLFVTKDGRVKILDFGLAKVTAELDLNGVDSTVATLRAPTNPGVVMGTVGYMSPEQVRGIGVDHRSDIFSFGAVLYEMLTGTKAFKGDSAVEVLNSILKDEPPELVSVSGAVPYGLDRIVRHCLEKHPETRFQSASDLAFDLEAQSLYSGPMMSSSGIRPLRFKKRWLIAAVALVVIAALATSAWFYRDAILPAATPTPMYSQLTYRKGAVHTARFAPDGETIIYSAAWEGRQSDVYLVRPGNPESRSLNLPDTYVLAVSKTGEMAVLNKETLSRVAFTGGAPRAVLENVYGADWSPERDDLAVVRYLEGRHRLEYPIGKVLVETESALASPRFSPDGKHIAIFKHPILGDDRGLVMIVDLDGSQRVLTDGWTSLGGLAWSPTGTEIWFAGARTGANRSINAVDLEGKTRLISDVAGSLYLHDVTPDGRALVTRESNRMEIMGSASGEGGVQDLSWLDGSLVSDVSADGKTVLFSEVNHGGGTNYSVYTRLMDGSPAVKIGEGMATSLSPDGRWALSIMPTAPPRVVMLPTGAGEPRTVIDGGFEQFINARWYPDGQHVLVVATEKGKEPRSYSVDVNGGGVTPVTPEGVRGSLVSPDGKFIAAVEAKTWKWSLYPLDGGSPIPIETIGESELPIRWSADGKSLFVRETK
ncbi:MAG TPA: protein kinase, partial [Blastocatellia bacterium]|nr:protein kinase [Blastocatellia bacterium]